MEYINVHVLHISRTLNLDSMRRGSPEIEITSNQVCDMGCDICDRVTRNGNCPPPLVRSQTVVYAQTYEDAIKIGGIKNGKLEVRCSR